MNVNRFSSTGFILIFSSVLLIKWHLSGFFQGNQAPENGVLVFGLFLDGASWDPNHECLNDSRPGDRFSKLPEIHFEPVQVKVSRNLD